MPNIGSTGYIGTRNPRGMSGWVTRSHMTEMHTMPNAAKVPTEVMSPSVLISKNAAALSEIAENDYNLNIPRYVDTFEEEEAVNLKAISKELKKLEADMGRTDATIAGYCKELGIDTPF